AARALSPAARRPREETRTREAVKPATGPPQRGSPPYGSGSRAANRSDRTHGPEEPLVEAGLPRLLRVEGRREHRALLGRHGAAVRHAREHGHVGAHLLDRRGADEG